MTSPSPRRDRKPLIIASICAGVVVGMVGMSFAAVPLYDLFCRVTGYGGTTQRAEAVSDVILDREITVRFDGTVASSLPWKFAPEERTMTLRIGEMGHIAYRAQNVSGAPAAGTATFNVSPPQVGIYFNKIECFCFTEQMLAPGESVDMPVTFFIDPAFAEDENTKGTAVITLSYTFYPMPADRTREDAAAADGGA